MCIRDSQETARDIDVTAKKRFPNRLTVNRDSFTVQDKSNKACTRLLFDKHEVLVSPWHGEVWVDGVLKTSNFVLGNPPAGKTLRSYNMPMTFYKTKRGTVALKGAQPLILSIPYPHTVMVESATSRIK